MSADFIRLDGSSLATQTTSQTTNTTSFSKGDVIRESNWEETYDFATNQFLESHVNPTEGSVEITKITLYAATNSADVPPSTNREAKIRVLATKDGSGTWVDSDEGEQTILGDNTFRKLEFNFSTPFTGISSSENLFFRI